MNSVIGGMYSCEHMTRVHLVHNHAMFYLATVLKGRGISEEGGDQEERQGMEVGYSLSVFIQ